MSHFTGLYTGIKTANTLTLWRSQKFKIVKLFLIFTRPNFKACYLDNGKAKPFIFDTVGKLFSRAIFSVCQFFELVPESEIPAAEKIVLE